MTDAPARLAAALADRYRLERELGAGGMATVYLAHDLKHDRLVAVKVLKPELAAVLGADRFVVEIKTTASMSHPHILPLFDSGEADGFLYYVMPYIQGETIREKLNRETQCGVDEAVRIAREVADALDYAHRHGVIHRDIKPENILLHDGRAMVMDFGIALAVSAAGGGRMTETGLSLGTPHYMSPEQATAEKEISGRSDVYSLATVLYEMLAGNPPHVGASAQQIIMKIITEQPQPVTALRKSVPTNVAAAVAKALEKLPADRFASAKAFSDALGDPAFTLVGGTGAERSMAHTRHQRRSATVVLAVAAAIAAGLAAWGWWRPAPMRIARQLIVNMPQLSRVAFPVLSPFGDRVVFIGDGRLWVRDLAGVTSRPLEGTDDAMAPFWSPDGTQLGYWVGNRVYRIPVNGGAPALVATLDRACPLDHVCAGSWTDDAHMLLSSGFDGIYAVAEGGGPLRPFLMPEAAEHFHRVAALPGGKGAIFEVDPDVGANRIDVWDGQERRTLANAASLDAYVKPGYLLYGRRGGGDIWALRLRGAKAIPDGDPVSIVDRAFGASASNDGALLFQRFGDEVSELAWVDRAGAMTGTVGSDQGRVAHPALSPDERSIAFTGRGGIRIHAPDRGVRMPLGSPDTVQLTPVWSPEGDLIYYVTEAARGSDDEGVAIRVVKAEGGVPKTIVDSGFHPWISRDGRYLTYEMGGVERTDIWVRDLQAPTLPSRKFSVGTGYSADLRLSPDARFGIFLAGDGTTGKYEFYLSRFPGGEDRIQLSNGGVRYFSRAYWSIAGDQVYYVRESDGALMVVDVTLTPQVRLSAPRVLFTESTSGLRLSLGLAVSRDPRRFLTVRRVLPLLGQASAVVLMDNWVTRATSRGTP